MSVTYDSDVVAWADEQVALLRAGKLSQLDLQHIADEVEDVGKSARRELMSRIVVLLAHLLKWHAQPDRRGRSWEKTIAYQRCEVLDQLADVPSLRQMLSDHNWRERAWAKALSLAEAETGLEPEDFPAVSPWTIEEALTPDFLPR